jgi:hypothetical protein
VLPYYGCQPLKFLKNYIGNFDNNYIIFRNVENFKTCVFQITKVRQEKYWIFKNILFDEMNFF